MTYNPPLLYVNQSNGPIYVPSKRAVPMPGWLSPGLVITGHTPVDLAGFMSRNKGAGLLWNRMEVPKTIILISAG